MLHEIFVCHALSLNYEKPKINEQILENLKCDKLTDGTSNIGEGGNSNLDVETTSSQSGSLAGLKSRSLSSATLSSALFSCKYKVTCADQRVGTVPEG